MVWAAPCASLLLFLSACATTEPSQKDPVARNPRIANLQRAAALPWKDEGRCVVQEAFHPWPVVVERCFHALDTRRVQFHDPERRCTVAVAGAAAVPAMVGVCLLSQPYIVVGAVVVIGVVVVAVAIKEELDAYELRRLSTEDVKPVPETEPVPREPVAKRRPKPEGSAPGEDWPSPAPTEPQERRSECAPRPVPHMGGDALHNRCADKVPQNGFAGWDVLVNGKSYDALQLHARVLWEIKTDNFDSYSVYLQRTVVAKQVLALRLERDLARACGFNFRVGVRSAAHRAALERLDGTLNIVVMDWC